MVSPSRPRNGAASPSSSFSARAMIDEKIVECVMQHLYEVTLEQGREFRQAYFRRFTLVSKAWEGPASEKLYRNPYFGTARRAHGFQLCLKHHARRRPLVKKLIFGEGSTSDVKDWPTPQTVPDITRLSPNVEIIGFDGLHNVDLEAFRLALCDAKCLRELRACGSSNVSQNMSHADGIW